MLPEWIRPSKGLPSWMYGHDTRFNVMHERVRKITVKVSSGSSQGSGILIERSGQVYTVLTNEHVLQPHASAQIQTFDGQTYVAEVYPGDRFRGTDLALLRFRSPQATYLVVPMGRSASLKIGGDVLIAGFPAETQTGELADFRFAQSKVTMILDKALDGGYQVGHTDAGAKGMSGGPILNLRGELVAINGMHAQAIWGDPYIYQDASKPCPPMHQLMERSSWGVPIETFIRLVPPLVRARPSEEKLGNEEFQDLEPAEQLSPDVLEMRAIAEAAKRCQTLNSP